MKYKYLIIQCETAAAFGTDNTDLAEYYMRDSDYCVIDVEKNTFSDGDGPELLRDITEMDPDSVD